eukprot:COSAG01_NODE_2494_length_7578_cov_7.961626_8_plen_65_part_00
MKVHAKKRAAKAVGGINASTALSLALQLFIVHSLPPSPLPPPPPLLSMCACLSLPIAVIYNSRM